MFKWLECRLQAAVATDDGTRAWPPQQHPNFAPQCLLTRSNPSVRSIPQGGSCALEDWCACLDDATGLPTAHGKHALLRCVRHPRTSVVNWSHESGKRP